LELKEDVDARVPSITVTVDSDSAVDHPMWDVLDKVYFIATLLNDHIGKGWFGLDHHLFRPGPLLDTVAPMVVLSQKRKTELDESNEINDTNRQRLTEAQGSASEVRSHDTTRHHTTPHDTTCTSRRTRPPHHLTISPSAHAPASPSHHLTVCARAPGER
jgi:hypothetical protein